MKNLYKLFGIIAIVALIGFGMTACKEEGEPEEFEATTAGELTITGITGHDGEQMVCQNYSLELIGYERATNWYRPSGDDSTSSGGQWARINNGQIVFKIFKNVGEKSGRSGGYQSYAGNDQNVAFNVGLFSSMAYSGTVTVNFTNGKATVDSSAIVP